MDEVAESDLVARRQLDRVLRPGRRLHRPVRLRPEREPVAAADDRSVRRARSRVVARRQDARVQHRSLHDQSADPRVAGDLRLALLDLAAGTVRTAGGFEGAKNISPQWTADGRALYFVSDRGGISNIYRTEFGGATTQLTNLLTGASGITELSPALSAADGRLVFSAYEDDGYTIYALETAAAAGRRAGAGPADQRGGAAAAARQGPGRCSRRWRTKRSDCRPRVRPRSRPRNTSRSWGSTSRASRRSASARDPFGTYAAGGVSFVFSDMLGNHTLDTGGAGHQPLRRVRRHGDSTSTARTAGTGASSLDQTPYVSRDVRRRRYGGAGRAGLRRGRVPHPADRPVALRADLVSVQPLAARSTFSGGGRQIGFKQDLTDAPVSTTTPGSSCREDRDHDLETSRRSISARRRRRWSSTRRSTASPARSAAAAIASKLAQSAGSLTFTGRDSPTSAPT